MSSFQSRTTVTAALPFGVAATSETSIGRFEILGLIGEGGMGRVYLARDPRLQRHVAIKVILDEHACDPVRERIFEDEARLPSELIHPNLCIIFDAGRERDRPYIVMEFVRGLSLRHHIVGDDDQPGLGVGRALDIGRDIADALRFMHTHGLVHRDLKPSNVMITTDGRAKVLDFGLARRTTRDTPEGSRTGVVIGTPGYMAPEQCFGETIDQRADVFAFGCVLYECLSGCRAFDCRSTLDHVRLLNLQGPDFNRLPRGTPSAVIDILRACLKRDHAQRPECMDDVIKALAARPAHAPPPTTPTPSNLPTEISRFIGRDMEAARLADDLDAHRLVTLRGMGGVGKTRLAIELARQRRDRYPDGVWFVDLAPVGDPGRVPEVVASSLPFRCTPEDWSPLREARTLIILDNCEHVSEAAATIARTLLHTGPDVTLLATSHGPLGLRGERVFKVPLLECPDAAATPDVIVETDAVRLFLDRARLVDDTFDPGDRDLRLVAQICRRLDGVPLSIELAAAGVGATSLHHLAENIDQGLRLTDDLNGSDRPDRHRTLTSTIAWSEQQLSDAERTLFRRLSIFRAGWSIEAARAVCADDDSDAAVARVPVIDLLTSLCRRSLVVYETERRGGGYRFLESVRLYARSALHKHTETASIDRLHTRHVHHFLQIAEDAAQGLRGAEQHAWATLLDTEGDNLLAALESAAASPALSEKRLRLATAMHRYWYLRGRLGEGLRHLQEAISAAPEAPPERRAAAHNGVGILAWEAALHERAAEHYLIALDLWRDVDNLDRIASVLANLGMVRQDQGRYDDALRCLEESITLFESDGNRLGATCARLNLGALCLHIGRPADARHLFEKCRPEFESAGDGLRLGMTLHNIGVSYRDQECDRDAMPYLASALREFQEIGYEYGTALALMNLAKIQARHGHDERAVRLLAWADALWAALGSSMPAASEADYAQIVRDLNARLGESTCRAIRLGAGQVETVRSAVKAFIERFEPQESDPGDSAGV